MTYTVSLDEACCDGCCLRARDDELEQQLRPRYGDQPTAALRHTHLVRPMFQLFPNVYHMGRDYDGRPNDYDRLSQELPSEDQPPIYL